MNNLYLLHAHMMENHEVFFLKQQLDLDIEGHIYQFISKLMEVRNKELTELTKSSDETDSDFRARYQSIQAKRDELRVLLSYIRDIKNFKI